MLSSHTLIELVYDLPDDHRSRFKSQAPAPFGRDGQWPEWMQMLKVLTNENILHRAGLYAGGDNEYEFKTFLDPIERVEHAERAVAEDVAAVEAEATFESELG